MKDNLFKPTRKYQTDTERFLFNFFNEELRAMCYEKVIDLDVSVACSDEPTPFSEIKNLEFRPIKIGEVWAKKNFYCGWFHLQGQLPSETDRAGLCLDFGNDGEGLLVDGTGSAVKGFTCGSPIFGLQDYATEKRYFPLSGLLDADGKIDLYIDGASNGLVGEFLHDASLTSAAVVRVNEEMLDIFRDFDLLFSYYSQPECPDERKTEIYHGLRKVMNLIVYHDADAYRKAKKETSRLLSLDGKVEKTVTAIGHSHLDLAWLWPIRESKRKALRTFANAVQLSKKYPDFRFVVSQPQQLEWVKNTDADLYKEVLSLLKSGVFEPSGGGWVENDTNIPCGESLVRQELYGQKFWKEEVGHYVSIRWLPDAFGYTACIPQILRLSGQDSFMTIKISWSMRTLFPYNTFYWQGIDGSQVLVHMPPEGDYNSRANPAALFKAERSLRETDPKDGYLMVYGVGDGGGGPSEHMVETCIREKDVPYLPKVRLGTAQEYFETLKGRDLPVYSGEMYLERHRGTYTSESNSKNFNREFEGRMCSLETLLSCRGEQGNKAELDRMWKEALLYQFHDILPGSSITRVYRETEVAYKKMFATMETMANACGASFVADENKNLMNFGGGDVFAVERIKDGYLCYCGNGRSIPPIVYKNGKRIGAVKTVQTDYYSLTFDADGSFGEIKSKSGKLIVQNANKLRVFIDRGDAWDFEDDYRDQPEQYMFLESTEVTSFGDITEIKQYYTFLNSRLCQTIVLHKHDPLVRIYHAFDWKDTGYMVRAEFLPAVWNDNVHCGIQFGYLDRPTTDNDAHEAAQFEICAHGWFDISENNGGFSVLNNAKNGFMAKQKTISLDLLRSTNYPYENSEQKHIEYSYALYAHDGGFDPVKCELLAKDFNARRLYGEAKLAMPAFDNDALSVTAFKPAYDGNGFIFRAFECSGKEVRANLAVPEGFELVGETDLLEDKTDPIGCAMTFRPFEIRTFKIRKAD